MNTIMKIILVISVIIVAASIENVIEGSGIIVVILAVIAYYMVKLYNDLVSKRNGVKSAWSKIDIQLNRRADLIQNLVETVKEYSIHERETLTEVAQARSGLLNSSTVTDIQDSNNALNQALANLYAVCENYPQLKANQNFLSLQSELAQTENAIAKYREIYNNYVLVYNNACEQFPNVIVAKLLNFKIADFFETESAKKELPKVKF